MSKAEAVKGVIKMLFWMAKEELDVMDHKLLRIGFGIISFAVAAAFWFFLYRTMGVV